MVILFFFSRAFYFILREPLPPFPDILPSPLTFAWSGTPKTVNTTILGFLGADNGEDGSHKQTMR